MASVDMQVRVTMSDDEAADIMTTALEGGIGYWCRAHNVQRRQTDAETGSWEYVGFRAFDTQQGEFVGEVNYDTIRKGVDLVVNGKVSVNTYYRDMILRNFTEDDPMDAGGADIVVQAGILGEVVYG